MCVMKRKSGITGMRVINRGGGKSGKCVLVYMDEGASEGVDYFSFSREAKT